MTRSAYGNPQPYAVPELERSALVGRLRYQQHMVEMYRKLGDFQRLSRAMFIIDELLSHLIEVDSRSVTASMEKSND
jgi:hypothetical protein